MHFFAEQFDSMKVAILSDLHANKYAVRGVFDDLRNESIDRILIAGDLIGYYYWPKDVVELCMEDSRVTCIQGNHERNLLDARTNHELRHKLTKKYGSGYESCLFDLTTDQLDWLKLLPQSLEIELDQKSFYLGHGALLDPDQYLYPDSCHDQIVSNYSACDFTIFGHTHYSFVHSHENKTLLNPGSVGQPRDIGNLASYAIVDTSNSSLRFKKVRFDVEGIISQAQTRDPDLPYLQQVFLRGWS